MHLHLLLVGNLPDKLRSSKAFLLPVGVSWSSYNVRRIQSKHDVELMSMHVPKSVCLLCLSSHP